MSEHVSEVDSSDLDGCTQGPGRKRKRRETVEGQQPVLGLSQLIQFKHDKEARDVGAGPEVDPLRRSSLEANFLLEDVDSFP